MKSDKLQHSEGSGVHKRDESPKNKNIQKSSVHKGNESQKVGREKEKWRSLRG